MDINSLGKYKLAVLVCRKIGGSINSVFSSWYLLEGHLSHPEGLQGDSICSETCVCDSLGAGSAFCFHRQDKDPRESMLREQTSPEAVTSSFLPSLILCFLLGDEPQQAGR